MSLDEIVCVRTPERTASWTPIPHGQLIETVQGALRSVGMEVGDSTHALARNGDRYFGLMEVRQPGIETEDYAFVLGLRNSHDKSFPAGMVAGSSVFCCDNLAFSGEVKVARKHTYYINRDLPMLVGRAVGQLAGMWRKQDERFTLYKEREVSDSEVHDLVIRACDLGAIPNQTIPKVLSEWRKPSHEEFRPRTVWSLFNSFTEAYKGSNVMELPKRTVTLHGLMDAHVGIGRN